MIPMVQARNVSPGHLGSALSVLLKEDPAEPQEGAKQWAAHIAATADGAMRAAEASYGIEGAHDAALARAEALVRATDGFTAQVELPAPPPAGWQWHVEAVLLRPCNRRLDAHVHRRDKVPLVLLPGEKLDFAAETDNFLKENLFPCLQYASVYAGDLHAQRACGRA